MVFPIRVAAIDIGSNAIRFVAAQFETPASYRVIEQLRLPVRLGRSVFDNGDIAVDAIDATVQALHTVADIIHDLTVNACRAVATSAVRDSQNGALLVARARAETGIEIDVIGGDEEARLVYLAARSRIDLGDRPHLLVDIGGGSMEIAVVDAHAMHVVESHPVGALRFAAHATNVSDDAVAVRVSVQRFVDELRASPALRTPVASMIAVGGSVDTLARIAGSTNERGRVLRIHRSALGVLIEKLAPLTYQQRAAEFNMPSDRADVILPAAMLYEQIAAAARIDEIVAPQVGVKEGVLLDLAAQVDLS